MPRGSHERGRGHAARGNHRERSSGLSEPAAILEEAGRHKQAAERRVGTRQCARHLKTSVELYRSVLSLSPSPSLEESVRLDALFELAEVYQLLSDSVLVEGREASGSPVFDQQEGATWQKAAELARAANQEAANWCRQAFETYEKIISSERSDETLKQNSLVNSANALVAFADVSSDVTPGEGEGKEGRDLALKMLEQAEKRYKKALSAAPEDTEIYTNLGDSYVKRAELVADRSWEESLSLYEKSSLSYEKAVSLCDGGRGDDLSGLLHNWGLSFLSLAQKTPQFDQSLVFFSKAEEKFRNSIEFKPFDLTPKLALGETLNLHSEKCQKNPELHDKVLPLLHAALNECYLVCLGVDSSNLDALLGAADCQLAAGKWLKKRGDLLEAFGQWEASFGRYKRVVDLIRGGTSTEFSFTDQSDFLYNLACCASLLNNEEQTLSILQQLKKFGALSAVDLANDDDFEPLRSRDWFKALLV